MENNNSEIESQIRNEAEDVIEPALEEKKEPTQEEIQARLEKDRQEYEEKQILFIKEKLMPIFKEADLKIKDSSMIVEILYQVLQQSTLNLARNLTVKDLKVVENINNDYPNAKVYLDILEAIKDEPVPFSISAIQTMAQKIGKDIEKVYIDKTFNEVVEEI